MDIRPPHASSGEKSARRLNVSAYWDVFLYYITLLVSCPHYLGNNRIIITIDELDRCRPTYAVKLFETIKTLFNIPKLTILLAFDTLQLRHTITSYYGIGFDSEKYLRRFINYSFKFTKPNIKIFIENLHNQKPILFKNEQIDEHTKNEFFDIMSKIFDYNQASLRDIKNIYSDFYFFVTTVNPPNIINECFYSLTYLIMLVFKYCDAEAYNNILSSNYKFFSYTDIKDLSNDFYNLNLLIKVKT